MVRGERTRGKSGETEMPKWVIPDSAVSTGAAGAGASRDGWVAVAGCRSTAAVAACESL